jgi:hypothetical protein
MKALRDMDNNEILDPTMIPAGVSPMSIAASICTENTQTDSGFLPKNLLPPK